MMGGVYIWGARIVFAALFLSGALRWLARDEADYSLQKCIMVMAPVSVIPLLAALLFIKRLHPAAVMVIAVWAQIAVCVYLVHRYCWVTLPKAIAAAALLVVGSLLLDLSIALIRRQVHKPVTRTPAASPAAGSVPSIAIAAHLTPTPSRIHLIDSLATTYGPRLSRSGIRLRVAG